MIARNHRNSEFELESEVELGEQLPPPDSPQPSPSSPLPSPTTTSASARYGSEAAPQPSSLSSSPPPPPLPPLPPLSSPPPPPTSSPPRFRVLATLVKDWGKDPFIRCGYTSPTVGAMDGGRSARVELAKPHHQGRTWFCGEATNPDVDCTIQAAMGTGVIAARGLLGAVQKRGPSEAATRECPDQI